MTSTNTTRRTLIAGAAAAGAVAALPAAAASDGMLHEIEIRRFAYKPAQLTVKPGDRIRWTNRDRAPHDATATANDWKTSIIRLNESTEITVTAGMSADYFCSVHPQMRAKVTVA